MNKEQKIQEQSEQKHLLADNSTADPQLKQKNKKLPAEMCEQGRKLLKQQKYFQASKSLSKAVMAFQYMIKKGHLTKQQVKQMFQNTMIPVYSNLSLCYLKMEHYQTVVSFSNQILNHESSHVKARFRRALAYQKIKKFDQAIEDFQMVKKLDVEMVPSCQRLIRETRLLIRKEKEKQRKIASTIIGGINDSRSSEQKLDEKSQTKEDNMKGSQKPGLIFKIKSVVKYICKKLRKKKSQ